jgi:S-adenosylmethionine synthetase
MNFQLVKTAITFINDDVVKSALVDYLSQLDDDLQEVGFEPSIDTENKESELNDALNELETAAADIEEAIEAGREEANTEEVED